MKEIQENLQKNHKKWPTNIKITEKKKMKKEMKCYNVFIEKRKKKYLFLADEKNLSDSGYIGRWLIMPSGKKIKIDSIVFLPKNVIDEMPYNLKTLTLADLRFEEEGKEGNEACPISVEIVKQIFRNMGISI